MTSHRVTHRPTPAGSAPITEAEVKASLEAIRARRPLAGSPLLSSACLDQRLRERGIPADDAHARERELKALVVGLITDNLARVRQAHASRQPPGRAKSAAGRSPKPEPARPAADPGLLDLAEAEQLRKDFGIGAPASAGSKKSDRAREAWSCLYYYFLGAGEAPPLEQIAIAAYVQPDERYFRRHVQRRLDYGISLLADYLRDLDHIARIQQARRAEGTQDTAPSSEQPRSQAPSDSEGVATQHPPPLPGRRWTDVRGALGDLLAMVLADTLPLNLPREQARLLAGYFPVDMAEYHLTRVAAWCRARYALDKRFVALSMLVDQGEDSPGGRWATQAQRYEDLAILLAEVHDPALVLLGAPGSGKSTLLRRLEFELAAQATRAEAGQNGRGNGRATRDRGESGARRDSAVAPITFFAELGRYARGSNGKPPDPLAWLADNWRRRYPDLPALDVLLDRGGVILLLDALNEMPHADREGYRRRVQAWQAALVHLTRRFPGNRVIFSCRSLDYSAPLSSGALRVPQVRVEPLDDGRIRSFLEAHTPEASERLWTDLVDSGQVEFFRTPYFLKLLVEPTGAADGEAGGGRAALLTGMIRGALRREIERVNPLLDPGPLIAERDHWRLVQARQWPSPYALPERGDLIGALADLAFGMQQAGVHGEGAQLRLPYDEACARLGSALADDILRAGEALGLLDDDAGADEVRFVHQLVQEYFAARRLAAAPEPALLRAPWRAAEIRPPLSEVMAGLGAGEPMPVLPQTGWEETALLAAPMATDSEAFLRGLMAENLVVAGRCANLPELRGRLPAELLDALRRELIARSRDPEAEIRARIAAGLAVGELGDPRWERREGPHGVYLMPPLVEIAGGVYLIGDDEPIEASEFGSSETITITAHMPRREIELAAYLIGRFPVTNAEYRCFMEAGGYEDERWWDTEDARAWRRGELADEGGKLDCRLWRKRFQENPDLFEQMVGERRFASDEAMERWREWMLLDEASFEAALDARFRAKRATEPEYWQDARLNAASQPVVGVSWYEARAYLCWLSAQTGQTFRLPTEVEWEAAARGTVGRRYAYGDAFDRAKGNTQVTRVKRTTPVGVFVEGDTPEGVSDMAGNAEQWTSSAGTGESNLTQERKHFDNASDGLEDLDAGTTCLRVVRGGGWFDHPAPAYMASRVSPPAYRHLGVGFRCCLASSVSVRAP